MRQRATNLVRFSAYPFNTEKRVLCPKNGRKSSTLQLTYNVERRWRHWQISNITVKFVDKWHEHMDVCEDYAGSPPTVECVEVPLLNDSGHGALSEIRETWLSFSDGHSYMQLEFISGRTILGVFASHCDIR